MFLNCWIFVCYFAVSRWSFLFVSLVVDSLCVCIGKIEISGFSLTSDVGEEKINHILLRPCDI